MTIAEIETGSKHAEKGRYALPSSAADPVQQIETEVKTNVDKLTTTAEKMVSLSQGNIDVIMKAGQIWAAGLQDISKAFAASAQAQIDHNISTWKALGSVRSPTEAMELQTSLARKSFDHAVAEIGKLAEASMKLAEKTLAPITAHMTHAAEPLTHPAG